MAIDPDFLATLDRFDASIDRRSSALQRGEQRSTEIGEGLVFSDHRQYVPGDDTRLIDWTVYARSDELYVRQFETERNLTVHVLLDRSESMAFADRSKFEFAAKIGLGYCYLFAAEHNDFRLSTLGARHERLDSGASTTGALLPVIDRLNEVALRGQADVEAALSEYAETIASRSLVVIASDCLLDPEAFESGLAALSEHDVVVVHAVAPEELSPPVDGETIFEGLETETSLRTYFSPRKQRQYRKRLSAHWDAIESAAVAQGGEYVRATTDEPFYEAFERAWIG